mgnify:CR=1 FL=1
MHSEELLYDTSSAVARITLNRPDALNALTPALLRELERRLSEAADDPAVRVLVVTGAGPGFCAGADVKHMERGGTDWFVEILAAMRSTFPRLRRFPKPTIAALNGIAVGGGFELALQCDFRLAAAGIRLGSLEVGMGQPMTNGATFLLSRLVGEARAREIGMLGELVDAERALATGLVNAVAGSDGLAALTVDWSERLASRAPLALAEVKRCFERAPGLADAEAAAALEAEAAIACFLSEDQREGLAALRERRPPSFRGR